MHMIYIAHKYYGLNILAKKTVMFGAKEGTFDKEKMHKELIYKTNTEAFDLRN